MRIGERKLLVAREKRWSRAYDALDPIVLDLQKEEEQASRRNSRLGLVAAIILHIGLFFVVFPPGQLKIYKVAKGTRVYKLQQVSFSPPPKPQVRRSVSTPEARMVPVPDATPKDPEPMVDDHVAYEDHEFPGLGEAVDIPTGPPGPSMGALQIGGDVMAPVRIFAPDPVYPEEARQARIQGAVILQTVINKLGNVTDIRILKGLPSGLSEAAVEAVSRWRFEPATLEGEPVAVYYLVTVSFSVQ